MNSIKLSLLFVVPFALMGCGAETTEPSSGDDDVVGDEVTTTEQALAGCTVFNILPRHANGRVYARTRISCSTTKSKIWVKTWLSRNNVGVAEGDNTCSNTYWCDVTVSKANSEGNQKWCTSGAGSANNGSPIGDSPICETAAF